MIRSSDPAPILVSGASAMPRRRLQRLRARMMLRKRLTLSATAAGGLPASTCSKCRRASLSSPLRKKARASSRRTRTSSGCRTSMRRNAAIASSSRASRFSSETPRFCAAPIADMPLRNSALAWSMGPRASGRSTASTFSYRPALKRARASFMAPGGDSGGAFSAPQAGAARARQAAIARLRRREMICKVTTRKGGRKEKEGGKTCHPLP